MYVYRKLACGNFNVGNDIQLTWHNLGNGIDAEGVHALAESLKQNTTLTQLNLKRKYIRN